MSETQVRRKPSQERSRDKVSRVLHGARQLLLTEGITRFTTNRVAEYAGITISSLYQYFPNKQSILVQLYEDYLSDIRQAFATLESPAKQALPWEEYFAQLQRNLTARESGDDLDLVLEKALQLYPELSGIDQAHKDLFADLMVVEFKRLGSEWSENRLRRLAYYAYELNGAAWTYKSLHNPPRAEVTRWEQSTFMSVVSLCFE